MSQKIYTDLDIKGNTTIGSIANATTDTDKFLVSDNGLVKYRTGAEMLSDLGVAPGVASNVQHQVKAEVAINKGQAVYVTSANGTNMIVGLASNTSEATSSKTMGLLDSTVAINGFANVITEGLLAGLNTIGATAGDPVWLGTDGNLIYGLINKPYAPAHLVFIGIVTRVNASNGEIFVKVQNGFELNEIHDVDLKTTTPVNGDILGFNGNLWVNKTIAGWLGYTPADASHTHTFDSLTAKTSGTGTYQTSGDFRAPIFYDLDNTGYYTNPAGQSNLNTTNVRRYYQATDGIPTSNLGNPSVTEMALFGEQFNNKTAFYNHNNLSFWTSSDGVNFTEYTGFSTTAKKRFLGGDYDSGVYIPNLTNRFRIELENSGGYVFLNQLYMYWSSNSHSTKVHIWVRRCDNNQWYQWTDSNQDISAWPGHLYLPFSGIPFYPGSPASTGHYNRIRIEFIPTWSSGTYSHTDISLHRMQIWGGYPAGKRNIYTIDENQNITFPETVYANSSFRAPIFYDSNNTGYYLDPASTSNLYNVTANTFVKSGGTSSQFLKADGSVDSNTYATTGSLTSYVPTSRTITINGVSQDLSTNRSWTIASVETDTLATVTGRGASTNTTSTFNGGIIIGAGQNLSLTGWGESHRMYTYDVTGTGNGDTRWVFECADDFTYNQGWEFRSKRYDGLEATRFFIPGDGSTPLVGSNAIWHAGNLTNLNQLSNGPGYITSSSSITGNAATATTLQTPRTINGTSFNGSSDIETSYWGATRTITIGNTGKTVNGSGNQSWSLAEIGAQAALTNPVTGTGTTNYVSKFTGTTTLGNSQIFDNGTNVLIGTSTDDNYAKLKVSGGSIIINNNQQFNSYKANGLALAIFKVDTADKLVFNPLWGQGLSGYSFTINGSEKMSISTGGSVTASSDMRAPVFYDSGNTAYYVDPASTSNLSIVRAANRLSGAWIGVENTSSSSGNGLSLYDGGNYGGGAPTYGMMFAGTGTFGAHGAVGGGDWATYLTMSDSTTRGWIFRRGSTNVASISGTGTITTDGYIYANSYIQSANAMYSPIYYDGNNSSFYVDPASTSNLNTVITRQSIINSCTHTTSYIQNELPAANNGAGTGIVTLRMWCSEPNLSWDGAGFGYNVYNDGVGPYALGRPNTNFGQAYMRMLSNGVWYFNTANTSGTRYTNMELNPDGNVYFGNMAQAASNLRAPIFYDSNNTSYYFDGSSTGDSIRCAGDIVAYYSDERLKDKKGNIENALEKVLSLNGFYYTPNDKAQELGYKYKEEVGVSAQEVEEVLPQIIKDAPIGQGYKTLDYGKLTPLLIEAIKEQQKQIEELKELVNKLITK